MSTNVLDMLFASFEAGQINREYREAQLKGAPYPILWIAEYFTLDGEGIRWGRFYRQAGFYSHALIWSVCAACTHHVIAYRFENGKDAT